MRIETDDHAPLDVHLMLNADDIDGLIARLKTLKAARDGHFDIYPTSADKIVIANIEVSYAEHGDGNYAADLN